MNTPGEPFADPSTSKEEIFRATYLALVEYGYADLSIKHIADEASLSKSTIYHHFDDKNDLVMAFAERLLEWYIDRFLFETSGDPVETLEWALDLVFLEETEDGLALEQVQPSGVDCVYMDLRAQATRNPELRDYFDALDSMMRDRLVDLIEAGVENGTLREVDPHRVAATLFVLTEGALYLRGTEGEIAWLRDVREMIDGYLRDLKREPVGSAGEP